MHRLARESRIGEPHGAHAAAFHSQGSVASGAVSVTRPLTWALGTLAATAISATIAAGRLAERTGTAEPQIALAVSGESAVTVAADLSGHFVIHPQIGSTRLRMLVDTGATLVALTHEDAERIGLRLRPGDYTRRLATANGEVAAAPVRLEEVRVEGIVVRGVDAVVLPRGRLGASLLGMSFLRRLKGFEVSSGRLTLRG